MGSCLSTEEQKRSAALAREMGDNHKEDRKTKKLLLLGAGGSGKSTFFKQLGFIHGERNEALEHETYSLIIYSNIVQGMEKLLRDIEEFDDSANVEWAEKLRRLEEEKFEENRDWVPQAVESIWSDKNVALHWQARRKDLQIQDSFVYFCEEIGRICEVGWRVNEQDVVRARIRTTGIVEQTFLIKQNKFQVYDVGGQRNERKKWIHCFEKVTAVIFLASLAAYNQTLYEDDQTNRMKEALDLFKQICNSRWFKETAMILFLNKKDIFQTQVGELKEGINTCFPSYTGAVDDVYESREFIKKKFVDMNTVQKTKKNGKSKKKSLFVHYTCVIDKNQVEKIFRDVQSLIIQANLEKAALI